MKRLTTDLDTIPWLEHGFFTRQGGVSEGIYDSLNCGLFTKDTPENVRENRARVAAVMGIAPENLLSARQVHGKEVAIVDRAPVPPGVDALVTDKPGFALGILTADCVPVLFAARKGKKVVGAAHAGWKGALGGVLEETVAAMQRLGAEKIEAAIGPCIRQPSYEVQDDFRETFVQQDAGNARFFIPGKKPGHPLFDLPGYVAHRLGLLGLAAVHDTKQDTCALDGVFFSNRRTFLRGEQGFGLQISVISIQ